MKNNFLFPIGFLVMLAGALLLPAYMKPSYKMTLIKLIGWEKSIMGGFGVTDIRSVIVSTSSTVKEGIFLGIKR